MRIYALLARTSLAITVAATVLLGGCATIDSSQGAAVLDSGAKAEGKSNGRTIGELAEYSSGKQGKKIAKLLKARGLK